MRKFVGREAELSELRNWSGESRISAIYGRRRIGKTRLVEEACRDARFIKFEGLEAQSSPNQRRHFRDTLARLSGNHLHTMLNTSHWEDLLIALSEYLGKAPTVVLFDEFQWMAAERNELVSTLKFVWDNYFLCKNNVHLIICGSVSSFIVKNVVRSKALFGRINLQINLGPLRLREVRNGFFSGWSKEEVLRLYLTLGGIPKYLEMCDPHRSFEQNIIDLFFKPMAPLLDELTGLFVSHFGKNPDYARVIEYLSSRKYATRQEIADHLGHDSGGGLSSILSDLEMAGFIEFCPFIRGLKKGKAIHYRIKDMFLRFFFKFVQPRHKKLGTIRAPLSIPEALPYQMYNVWQGFAFEALCHSHADEIARALGFSAVEYEYGSAASSSNHPELDLVFVRKDGVITICEIKSGKEVDKSAIEQARSQVENLQPRTNKTVQAALIASGNVDRCIKESRFFSAIIGLDAFM